MRTIVFLAAAAAALAQPFRPEIPKTWDEDALRTMELPLPAPAGPTVHVSAARYYAVPAAIVYRTYPITVSGKTEMEHRAWLLDREPEVIKFDSETLRTRAGWIEAGKAVFEWQTGQPSDQRGANPTTNRVIIREKGKLGYAAGGCSSCHERHQDDGSVIRGAQMNFSPRWKAGRRGAITQVSSDFATPWLRPDPNLIEDIPAETLGRLLTRVPSVAARFNSSLWSPPAMPDLIGVRDRKYLDRTGQTRHRGIGDLMRYAALNQGIGNVALSASYGGYIPNDHVSRPRPLVRFSDEQLYALALYIYSLEPPKNPNKPDSLSAEGEKIFAAQGCAICHPAPLYTNNKLTPAPGFRVPEEHKRRYDIMPVSVGTDPWLALKTRRGSGYYKVPSLRGVGYRGPFEHNGSVLSLEDWFDPAASVPIMFPPAGSVRTKPAP